MEFIFRTKILSNKEKEYGDSILLMKYLSGTMKNKYCLPGNIASYNVSAENSCLEIFKCIFNSISNYSPINFNFVNVYGDGLRHPQMHLISSVFELKFDEIINNEHLSIINEIASSLENLNLNQNKFKMKNEEVSFELVSINDIKNNNDIVFCMDYKNIVLDFISL